MNKPFQIGIIDDEPGARTIVSELIDRYLEQPFHLHYADSISTGKDLLHKQALDILFLDIHFPKGLGFDILDSNSSKDIKIIFTTAYDVYALKAFKYAALDYLLKPLDPSDFEATLQKILHSELHNLDARLRHLELIIKENNLKRIALPSQQGIVYIKTDDIIMLKSDGNYTKVFSKEKEFMVTRVLKEFEEILPSKNFCRVHKSFILNLDHVVQYDKEDELVSLEGGIKVPLARRRKNDFLGKF